MSNQPASRPIYNALLQHATAACRRSGLTTYPASTRPRQLRFDAAKTERFLSTISQEYGPLSLTPNGMSSPTPVAKTSVSIEIPKSFTRNNDDGNSGDRNKTRKRPSFQQHTRQPLRVATLYEALVRPTEEDISPLLQNRYGDYNRSTPRRKMPLAVSLANGKPMKEPDSDHLLKELKQCTETANAQRAIDLLHELRTRNYQPTARAVIMAIDACVAAKQLEYGEHALTFLHPIGMDYDPSSTYDQLVTDTDVSASSCDSPMESANNQRGHDPISIASRDIDGLRAARTVLAVAYTSKNAHEQATRVMGLGNWRDLSDSDAAGVAAKLNEMHLGVNAVSWGVIVKALTKLGQPQTAVSVVDAAMRAGVGMTDSFLHLTVDALRAAGKWREAMWIFDKACEKGLRPHERTIGSILLAMSSKQARTEIDQESIHRIVQKAHDPSPKFMMSALMALSAVGHVEPCERLFEELRACNERGVASEVAYSCMMAAYVNILERITEKYNDVEREKMYLSVNEKSEEVWKSYISTYRLVRPTGSTRHERDSMLIKYLLTKTRTFRVADAITVLEQVAYKRHLHPWMEVNIAHITMVMGAVELCCDVAILNRLLDVMRRCELRHDMRSLGFAVGTLVADGDLGSALRLVRTEFGPLLSRRQKRLDGSFRHYHPALLLRRLELLASAFVDVGVGKVPDLETYIADLRAEQGTSNVKMHVGGFARGLDKAEASDSAKDSTGAPDAGIGFDFDPQSKNR